MVEGRERAQAAPARAAGAERTMGRRARPRPQAELERIAERDRPRPTNSRELQAAQAEEQAQQLPGLEDALREAQQRSNQQRSAVAEVQQQIQVLAAESRNVDEQLRQLQQRQRAPGRRAPGPGAARPAAAGAAAARQRRAARRRRRWPRPGCTSWASRCRRWTSSAARRPQAAASEAARQAELGARLDALRALQDKVQSEGKLKPWLAKHGLDSLQGLWTRVHIEPGWETALEAALRERLNALEVGRLETVRAFAADAPPTRLAFYSLRNAGAIASTHRTLPRLSDLLRLNDAGLQALLNDWLEGVYTARQPRRGAGRAQPADAWRSDHVARRPCGVAVRGELLRARLRAGRHAGAAAGDREPGAPAPRAGPDRRRGAQRRGARRGGLHRSLAAPGQRAPRGRRGADPRAPDCRWNCCACRSRPRPARRGAASSTASWPSSTRSSTRCASAAAMGEARFEELDLQLADAQQRHAELDDAVIAAERAARRGARAAARARAPGAGGGVPVAHAGGAPGRTAARDRNRAAAGGHQRAGGRADRRGAGRAQRRGRAGRAADRAGACACSASRRWPPRAASTTTSAPSCARPTSSA